MYATGNKKMLNMLILEILKVYTDDSHHLTQQEIIKLLKQNYDLECDRRSVRNNVECLNELGYEILYDKGYWLASREFEDAELRMLLDSVLSSRNLTNHQAKMMITKMENLTNEEIVVRLNCNENAMFYWALQYGSYVEVLEPENLRSRLRKAICDMREKYEKEI